MIEIFDMDIFLRDWKFQIPLSAYIPFLVFLAGGLISWLGRLDYLAMEWAKSEALQGGVKRSFRKLIYNGVSFLNYIRNLDEAYKCARCRRRMTRKSFTYCATCVRLYGKKLTVKKS